MNAKINAERLIENVVHVINDSNKELTQENANTNGSSPAGQMSLMAGEVAKEYGYNLINKDAKTAFENGFIHIHDFDYYATGTTTCCQIPLGDILKHDAIKGVAFKSGDCGIRTPKGIETAASLAAIILQTNQNQQHGGQSFPNWDFDLAPYVTLTYENLLAHYTKVLHPQEIEDEEIRQKIEAKVKRLARAETREATMQAMEAFVHNCNSMLCRNGMQVPFVSINFGLDTSWQGRLVSECTFLAQEKGIGNGETPIFPILVFKVKTGVNFKEEDPNYDLYKLGVRVLSTRLFPNFMFMDSSFNSKGFDLANPKTHPATMGCRTRVYENSFGESQSQGRGNLSFTTLNLPMLAKKSINEALDMDENIEVFLEYVLPKYMRLVAVQLKERYEYQMSRNVDNFKFLYKDGPAWEHDSNFTNGKVGDAIKSGSLGIGFIGLAETLILLCGSHHAETTEARRLGLKIVKLMRQYTNSFTEEYNLNYALLATPKHTWASVSK